MLARGLFLRLRTNKINPLLSAHSECHCRGQYETHLEDSNNCLYFSVKLLVFVRRDLGKAGLFICFSPLAGSELGQFSVRMGGWGQVRDQP